MLLCMESPTMFNMTNVRSNVYIYTSGAITLSGRLGSLKILTRAQLEHRSMQA